MIKLLISGAVKNPGKPDHLNDVLVMDDRVQVLSVFKNLYLHAGRWEINVGDDKVEVRLLILGQLEVRPVDDQTHNIYIPLNIVKLIPGGILNARVL